ncbi:MAG: hypothetical protein R8K46_11125 [Mariprofundaceae bacterium]
MSLFFRCGFVLLVCLMAAPVCAEDVLKAPVFELDGSFEDGVLSGELLFLAAREAEGITPDLQVFRIGKDHRVHKIGAYKSKDDARGIALRGDYIYLSDGRFGLEIIDVSDPSRPRLAAFQELDGYSHKLVIWRHYAIVASGFGGMHIIDVSKPAHPRLVSTFQAYPPPGEMDEDDGLFSADGAATMPNFAGMDVDDYDEGDKESYGGGDIDVSWEDYIREEGALDIAMDKQMAHLAYGSEGIVIVDISDPARPKKVSTTRMSKVVESIDIVRSTAYVTTGIEGLQLVNVAQPASPQPLGKALTRCYPMDVAVADDQAFVADGYCSDEGLFAINVSRPKSPKVGHNYPGKVGNVRIWGDYLLAMGQKKTRIYHLDH